jgi:septal ring factor EnvC (AmiA/AmiB activator)
MKDLMPVGRLSIENIRTDRSKTGILLTLKSDSLIKAPQNGLVVYADVFKGYGNMIILDLGNNYHLIFSGLSSIACKTGDWIEKGNILGDMGININKNDLYMEVRFKGKTINPNSWANS